MFKNFVTVILLFCDNNCDKNMGPSECGRRKLRLNQGHSCVIMLVFTFLYAQKMEAEHLNSIANALSDLTQRHEALRGYL